MSMIRLKPACKDYLWGGERLREEYHMESDCHPLAEAWVLSCHPDGPSVVDGGAAAGQTLPEYLAGAGENALGRSCRAFPEFPILIKLINSQRALSIQVHPSNEFARREEGQFGKTEAWYVLEAEPDAYLYCGFEGTPSQEEVRAAIQRETLPEMLHRFPAKKGDLFFIPPGTVHALGPGLVIAEIQQNSNVTYRLYDYGRLGADGKPRPLHIEKALAVANRCPAELRQDFGGHLVQCPYFTADILQAPAEEVCDDSSFVSLLVTDGGGTVSCGEEALRVQKGDSLILTAGSGRFRLSGDCQILRTRVDA